MPLAQAVTKEAVAIPMAKLMITLAVISLMASCLQVSSSIPIDFEREDKDSISDLENNTTSVDMNSTDDMNNTDVDTYGSGSGSGFSDLEKNIVGPDIDNDDDEDYSDERGSGTTVIPHYRYEDIIRMFCERLKILGIKYTICLPYY